MYKSYYIDKQAVVSKLQKEVLSLQGFKRSTDNVKTVLGLGPIESSFPNNVFATGAVHEFISYGREQAAASSAFITGVLGCLTTENDRCLWVGPSHIFPPGLAVFGINPHQVLFVDTTNSKNLFWTIEEALKCSSLTAVVGAISEISFKQSRRLQLAVEQSRVTGFIHLYNPRTENTLACVARWKINALPSISEGLPGLGYSRWHVELAGSQ